MEFEANRSVLDGEDASSCAFFAAAIRLSLLFSTLQRPSETKYGLSLMKNAGEKTFVIAMDVLS